MKSVKSLIKWILFVPVCLMSVALITISGLNPDVITTYFATDINGISEIIAFSVLGLFLACFVISLLDKTTSPVHMLKKNFFCGVASFVGAFGLASSAALDVTTMIQTGALEVMPVITAVFTALSGVALLFIGINHFTATNTPKELSIFYLVLPLWCGVHLIDRFLKHTAMPVDAADTLDLIMFVALAMFFINAMMIHAVIPGKNAVKSAITFGFPATVISLVYGLSLIFNVMASDSNSVIDYIPGAAYCVVGLYVLGFTAELSFKSKTVEEQLILAESSVEYSEDASDSEEPAEIADEPVDDAVQEDVSDCQETSPETEPEVTVASVNPEEITLFDDVEPAAVRIVDEDDEEPEDSFSQMDIPVNLPEEDSQEGTQCDIAEELYRAAQERDQLSDKDAAEPVAESEEEMIIEGEETVTSVPEVKTSDSHSRPKGPTVREAVMYEDDDFILAIDGSDMEVVKPVADEDDISTYILEQQEEPETPGKTAEKTYADRLDEIDQLIISIQGGDDSTDD
ncbi:MAG: oligosaccharide repeat unit polymerase [Ruminococcus sp.]|nr:oligosaccharide repeat unit polymerase [Ruminococcus sp.]